MSWDTTLRQAAPPAVTPEPDSSNIQASLQRQLDDLLVKAKAFGFVIDVVHQPYKPLAMGSYRSIGTVRPALKAR